MNNQMGWICPSCKRSCAPWLAWCICYINNAPNDCAEEPKIEFEGNPEECAFVAPPGLNYDMSINELVKGCARSARIVNSLAAERIYTVKDLHVYLRKNQSCRGTLPLLRIPNLGRVSYEDLIVQMKLKGFERDLK